MENLFFTDLQINWEMIKIPIVFICSKAKYCQNMSDISSQRFK